MCSRRFLLQAWRIICGSENGSNGHNQNGVEGEGHGRGAQAADETNSNWAPSAHAQVINPSIIALLSHSDLMIHAQKIQQIQAGRYLLKQLQQICSLEFELLFCRVVLAPMTRCRARNTLATDMMQDYYCQRATEGGLLISEGVCVAANGHGYAFVASTIPSKNPSQLISRNFNTKNLRQITWTVVQWKWNPYRKMDPF